MVHLSERKIGFPAAIAGGEEDAIPGPRPVTLGITTRDETPAACGL
jgi:hypothetical protein